MKLNELNEDMGIGGTAVKQFAKRMMGNASGAQSTPDARKDEIYINKFIGSAAAAIAQGIKAGTIDPKLPVSPSTPATPAAAAQPAAATGMPGPKAKASWTAPVPGAYDDSKTQAISKAQLPGGDPNARTVVGKNTPRPAAPVATDDPNKRQRVSSDDMPKREEPKVLNKDGKPSTGMPGEPAAKPTLSNAQIDKARAVLKPGKVKPTIIGGKVMDPENPEHTKLMKKVATASKPKVKYNDAFGKKLPESQYKKLNNILESVMLTEAQSIYSFLKTQFLPKFLRGQDIDINDPTIDALIKDVQNSWAKGQGKAALTKLAHAAASAGETVGSSRAATTPTAAQPQLDTYTQQTINSIKTGLANLAKSNKGAYAQLMASLKNGKV